MNLGRYLLVSHIFDLKGITFEDSLRELVHGIQLPPEIGHSKEDIVDELLKQERVVSSCLGKGIALPHMHVDMRQPYLLALGRMVRPIDNLSDTPHNDMRILVLFLASIRDATYLDTLANLAKILQESNLSEATGLSPSEFRKCVLSIFRGSSGPAKTVDNFNYLMMQTTLEVAAAGMCSSIMTFLDTFDTAIDFSSLTSDLKIISITRKATAMTANGNRYLLPVQLFSMTRLSQLRSAILLGLTHKILEYNEKICCVGGIPGSNLLDTILVVDVEREIQSVFSYQSDILPINVRPEVFERLLTIATELAIEGREGSAVGCLFVLGNIDEIKPFTRPLVLNPFFGYNREERHLLNPFIDETVKEFSTLDGAFIISGDGILESAGTFISTPQPTVLPGGLGTRHAAAMAISQSADCVALTVSASTGQVTLFRKGKMLPLIEKGVGNSAFNMTIPAVE